MKMILAVMAIGAACIAAPASAQSIAGCGTAVPSKSEATSIPKLTTKADCFAKAGTTASKAEKTHRDRIAALTPKPTPIPATPPVADTAKYWIDCAGEGGTCALPKGGNTRVRFGAGDRFTYKTINDKIACGAGSFGSDPAPGVLKTCAYESDTPAPAGPEVKGKPLVARDRLGLNVSGINYYSGEPIFANQLFGLRWLVPNAGWSYIADDRLRPDGFPKVVDGSAAAPGVVSILNPPMEAQTTATAVTRCTWQGKGSISLGGGRKDIRWADHLIEFQWPKAVGGANRVWIGIDKSDAADPIRAMDCRLTTDPKDALFAPQLVEYVKPFGVLRFLDMMSANGNPATATWTGRSLPGDLIQRGDGVALEHLFALSNLNGSSPWLTIPWNADPDYHRRAAQLAHDTIPAGRPVYVEISNEVWNYQFGQARQAQEEGLARGLSTNGFQANIARLAQKVTEIMPIWSAVFADRPADLVRVLATQAGNVWVGNELLTWNNSAVVPYVDAIAIAPYFSVPATDLTGDNAANMVKLAAQAKSQIASESATYKALTDRYGKRLIAYEGGQHQIDVDNQARLEAMNRDPAMQAIYRQYLTDWHALTGDLFTLYAGTGPITKYGAWGIREYAGQPLSETPKLRGVLDFATP